MEDRQTTELRATQTLLERGVKVRVRAPKLLRLLGRQNIVLTLRQPTGGALLRMGQWYLRCGIPMEKLEKMTVEEAMFFKIGYGGYIYNALACLFLVDKRLTWVFMKPLAGYLRENLSAKDALSLLGLALLHGGVEDFITITRLVKSLLITSPKLGR